MSTTRTLLGITAVTAMLITGCSAAGADNDDGTDTQAIDTEQTDATEDGSADTSADDAGADDDSGDDSGDDAESGEAEPDVASGAALDFRADSLHDDVEPAAAGSAYIEAGGERFEFSDIECSIDDAANGGNFTLIVQAETHEGPTELRMIRAVGDTGWAWVEDLVQLTLVGGTETRESNSIAMAQLNVDESGNEVDWLSGDGTLPLIRVVDNQATASGALKGTMFSDDPAAGSFTAAANCG